jgi:hypothetical protein
MARAPLVISGSDPVSVTLANITAYVNAGNVVVPTPAPVFTTQPSISPTSGTAGTTAFTATDGVASNASSYTRRWLLNETSIATGATVTPNAAGSLALEVTATGPGGSVVAKTAAVTVAAAIPALPSGVVNMWDAASLTSLANGAAVTTWTDSVGGAVATQTSDSTTPHTFVANSGGLPAVRTSGAAILTAAGAAGASRSTHTLMFIARNVLDVSSAVPTLVATSGDSNCLLDATSTQSGLYPELYPCGGSGLRTICQSYNSTNDLGVLGINGSAFSVKGHNDGGDINIGGWQSLGRSCLGKADILAVIRWNRALSAAEMKQVHRRYCALLGETPPAGRNVSFLGDSLTYGQGVNTAQSYPYQLAMGLGLPWGTFDILAIPGRVWSDVAGNQLNALGNVSAVTGTRSIVCGFEWYNEAVVYGSGAADIVQHAKTAISALLAQDPNREFILGTSTDAGGLSAAQVQNRSDYTAALVAGLPGVTSLVRIDLDPKVGAAGAAAADGGTYYQSDKIHLTAAGYALLDNGPYGFRPAAQARLAAA